MYNCEEWCPVPSAAYPERFLSGHCREPAEVVMDALEQSPKGYQQGISQRCRRETPSRIS